VPATSHWNTLQDLRYFGAQPVEQRFIRHGKIMTAAGVSAGIDMALQLVAIEYGEDVAKSVQLLIEYDPHPPLDSGSTSKASSATIDRARQMLRDMYAPPRSQAIG
jgi:transcriptional regulator GlxA family with amidase domain